jgi:very-short-patch-repair endonuclease
MIFTKKHFTRAERRFGRMLDEMRIPFKAKQIIHGHEIDFLIGRNVIEIDGHIQNTTKNKVLMENGYNVYHFQNSEVSQAREWLKKLIINK